MSPNSWFVVWTDHCGPLSIYLFYRSKPSKIKGVLSDSMLCLSLESNQSSGAKKEASFTPWDTRYVPIYGNIMITIH